MMASRLTVCAILALWGVLSACSPAPQPAKGGGTEPAKVTNRIDIPPEVVNNLGITFARVERRQVGKTLRLPGVFECPPEATRAYASPLAGRLHLAVKQYQVVQADQVLFTLDAPEFVALLHDIHDADAATTHARASHAIARAEHEAAVRGAASWPAQLRALESATAASEEHSQSLQTAADLWAARVKQLEDLEKAGGGRGAELAEARSRQADGNAALSDERERRAGYNRELAQLRAGQDSAQSQLGVLAAKVEQARLEADNAEIHADMLRHEVATTLGLDAAELKGDAWRKLDRFTQRAARAGVVTTMGASDGAWLQPGEAVVRTVDTSMLRLRARALQSDVGLLRDGLSAAIAPPAGGPLALAPAIAATTMLAPESDPDSRTLDVLLIPQAAAAWARPGITAEAEIVYDSSETGELAIPVGCVMQDGLDKIVFRRDPADPNKVIRLPTRLGVNDGRWIVIYRGVAEGDEIVLAGAYELKLTGAGKATGKGHFHADGTYHEGDD